MTEGEKSPVVISLAPLIRECHRRSIANGWWTDSPNLAEKIALIHSEISEADEAQLDGIGGPDKHLPQYPAVQVEIADAVIRICDLAGFLDIELKYIWLSVPKYEPLLDVIPRLANIFVSKALEGLRKDDRREIELGLCEAVYALRVWAYQLGMDFDEVIFAKLNYNDQRPDHKPENRNKKGGKKF